MEKGCFYFITDDYFSDFPDAQLMKNKDSGQGRPCFFAFQDPANALFWLVPISSQVEKYRAIYQKKTRNHRRCDTLVFGEVLGRERVFLIQNMCPVTEKYIANLYIDRCAQLPVHVAGNLEKEIIVKAKRVLALERNGKHLLFSDVLAIENRLLSEK